MKPNIIKLLIFANVVIFVFSIGVIYVRITIPKYIAQKTQQPSTSSSVKQTTTIQEQVFTEEKITPAENIQKIESDKISSKQKSVKSQKQPVSKPVIENNVAYIEKSAPTVRNIKFVFFSSKAVKVSLIGDFNDWLPQSLTKVAPNRWEIIVKIPAGQDYLYNFLVDGKVILDPNNTKPPQTSPQGFKSSVLNL